MTRSILAALALAALSGCALTPTEAYLQRYPYGRDVLLPEAFRTPTPVCSAADAAGRVTAWSCPKALPAAPQQKQRTVRLAPFA